MSLDMHLYQTPATKPPTAPEWQRAHEDLLRLAKTRARLDWEEGRSLLLGLRVGVHLHLGYGTFAEYVERLFGHKPRWTDERLRVAEALETLPELEQSLRDGALHWSTVRELTRVARAETEHAWIELAQGRTVRQIEELVSGHAPGDLPDGPKNSSLERHVLRFEVTGETLAYVREATAKVRREAGTPMDDDAMLLTMARQVLGGPIDQGRANYQVAFTVCEACGRGWQQGRGEQVEVSSEVVEMAECDAQHVGRIAGVQVQGSAHVGQTASWPRARQSIPPRLRREVMRRNGGRCVVPGCRNGVFLDLHHVKPRSEGGDHDPDTLIVLCGAHHRAQHRGQLLIEGRVSSGLVFRHADGTRYGSVVGARAAAAFEEAFRALRSLGFREGEARAALARVRNGVPCPNGTEQVLRAALAAMTPETAH
jgi:5-methylcytosine-specific restriction endonuclease McrA